MNLLRIKKLQIFGYLFMAGTETTSNTLDSATVLIVKHIEIQEKVRNELLNVMGGK